MEEGDITTLRYSDKCTRKTSYFLVHSFMLPIILDSLFTGGNSGCDQCGCV